MLSSKKLKNKAAQKQQKQVVIAPANEAQALFMQSDADIVIASGSAGSSKSYGILLKWLTYINDPNARGMIFRRTSNQITTVGGLWNEAIALYSQIDPTLKIKQRDLEIIFNNGNGARLKFSHYENEAAKIKLKGVQAEYIAFDEMTEFTEEQVLYLLSRNRNSLAKNKPVLCGATNPDYDSFLRKWIEWWLDPITGIPDLSKRGVKRYFAKQGNDMLWADTRAELEAIYGTGEDNGIMSMTVIGSTCMENPYIPVSYVTRLKSLSPVETARLLYGSWYARAEAAGYFKREWVEILPHAPVRVKKRVRSWDLSGQKESSANPDPDYSVGVLMSKTIDNRYVIEDVIRFRGRFHEVERKMLQTAENDGRDVEICVPRDPGAAGMAYAASLVQTFSQRGYYARMKPTNKSKLDRFRPFSAVAEARLVDVVSADWNKEYFTELESFDGNGKLHDDQVDATSDAFSSLKVSTDIPNFTLPDLSRKNPMALT